MGGGRGGTGLVIATMTLVLLIDSLDASIVQVALPEMSVDLGMSVTDGAFVVTVNAPYEGWDGEEALVDLTGTGPIEVRDDMADGLAYERGSMRVTATGTDGVARVLSEGADYELVVDEDGGGFTLSILDPGQFTYEATYRTVGSAGAAGAGAACGFVASGSELLLRRNQSKKPMYSLPLGSPGNRQSCADCPRIRAYDSWSLLYRRTIWTDCTFDVSGPIRVFLDCLTPVYLAFAPVHSRFGLSFAWKVCDDFPAYQR